MENTASIAELLQKTSKLLTLYCIYLLGTFFIIFTISNLYNYHEAFIDYQMSRLQTFDNNLGEEIKIIDKVFKSIESKLVNNTVQETPQEIQRIIINNSLLLKSSNLKFLNENITWFGLPPDNYEISQYGIKSHKAIKDVKLINTSYLVKTFIKGNDLERYDYCINIHSKDAHKLIGVLCNHLNLRYILNELRSFHPYVELTLILNEQPANTSYITPKLFKPGYYSFKSFSNQLGLHVKVNKYYFLKDYLKQYLWKITIIFSYAITAALILHCFKRALLTKVISKDKYVQSLNDSLEAVTDLYAQINLKRELLAADLRIKLEMLQGTYKESTNNIITFASPNQTSAKLVDEYLSHVEAGRYALYIKEITVKAVFEVALKLLSRVTLEKNITITSNIDDSLVLEFDESLLTQIIATVLNLSIGPLQKNGKINIHITVTEKEGIKGLSLNLKDNSYGVKLDREIIPAHLQSVLFTDYRLESMIKHYNGTIDTKLELGEGRELDLFLPSLSDKDQAIIIQSTNDNVVRIF
jgi:hypothetical protein